MKDKKILVGKVLSPHGLRGDVRVLTFTEKAEDFKNIDICDLNIKFIRKINNNVVICKIENVNNRNDAETYKNKELYINKNSLPLLDENEYYYHDLIGLSCFKDNINIGKVTAVYNFGAGDILEIDYKNLYSFKGAIVNKDSIFVQ